MAVSWGLHIDLPGRGDAAARAALEHQSGVSLPDDIRRLILEHAGDAAEPSAIGVGQRSETPVGSVLHAGGRTDHKRFTYSIEWVLGSLAEWSGTHAPGALRLFPFASNTATGYFCLYYRQSAANPPIVFVDFN